MKTGYELTQVEFDTLLGLFSDNRDEAGEKYEQMRGRLVHFFRFRGCGDPHGLADETINRVAARLHKFDASRNIQPASFFYGFAANILLEYRRRASKELELLEDHHGVVVEPDTSEAESTCLEDCLKGLSEEERQLIVDYYSRDRRERIELRQRLCQSLNWAPSRLYTRIFRIRAALRGCIERCISRKL